MRSSRRLSRGKTDDTDGDVGVGPAPEEQELLMKILSEKAISMSLLFLILTLWLITSGYEHKKCLVLMYHNQLQITATL